MPTTYTGPTTAALLNQVKVPSPDAGTTFNHTFIADTVYGMGAICTPPSAPANGDHLDPADCLNTIFRASCTGGGKIAVDLKDGTIDGQTATVFCEDFAMGSSVEITPTTVSDRNLSAWTKATISAALSSVTFRWILGSTHQGWVVVGASGTVALS